MTTPYTPPASPPSTGPNWGKIALFGCGGLLVLALIVVVAVVGFLVLRNRGDDAPAVQPTGETTLYRSADHVFNGPRADNFVDFSFRYPAHWRVTGDENSDTPNFVTVENQTEDQFTIENLSVGWISGPLQEAGVLDELARQFQSQQSATFPNYTPVMFGTTTLAGRDARYYTFTGHMQTEGRGDVEFYGRVVLVPITPTQGLVVLGMATELAEGVEGPAEVGVNGELRGIFDSFTITGAAPAAAAGTELFPGATVLAPGTAFYTAQGALEATDPLRPDGTLYDAYQLYLEAGRTVTLTLTSDAFDAYLTAVAPSGATTNDDDSGGGTNARLSMTVNETGTWTFLANSLSQGESGPYSLLLEAPAGP
jgi:hypothetical protein